jgi:hypothetical protein
MLPPPPMVPAVPGDDPPDPGVAVGAVTLAQPSDM